MNSDLITGFHGKPRCAWAGAGDTAFGRYHDEVWGTRTYDEASMFEALTLGVFEVGLSWSIVFGKRDAFRTVFHQFDVARVAAMTGHEIDRLVEDPSIIRNRRKIQATVDNARALQAASTGLAELAKAYEVNRKRSPRALADLPASTPESEEFARLQGTGLPLRGTDERLCVHAERRRGQRSPPRLLPRSRLQRHLNAASRSARRVAAVITRRLL